MTNICRLSRDGGSGVIVGKYKIWSLMGELFGFVRFCEALRERNIPWTREWNFFPLLSSFVCFSFFFRFCNPDYKLYGTRAGLQLNSPIFFRHVFFNWHTPFLCLFTDYVYFETSSSLPYQIRRIEELNKAPSGNVEAKVMCFYRRRDLPISLVQLADKHQSE